MKETIIEIIIRKKKITMKEFADKCDVSKYAIKKLIAGDFTIRGSNLIKVAKALKISSNMLYEDIKDTKEENKKNLKNNDRG